MKKMFAILLALVVLGSSAACASAKATCIENDLLLYSDAGENSMEESVTGLVVNGTAVDTSKLPTAFYKEGNVVMVPALAVCEKLGYTCEWDNRTGTLTIDGSIQKAILVKDHLDVTFVGKLKVIDLSGTMQYGAALKLVDNVVYVPAGLFETFFNEVVLTDSSVSISQGINYPDVTKTNTDAAYQIAVNGKPVETKVSAYKDNGILMLPLRAIGEALVYKVTWISKTEDIVMENDIQKVVLHNASATAQFTWKLKSMNYTGPIDLEAKAVVRDGVTYVPASLFELFFNDVTVEGAAISVSPSVSVLHG